MLDRMGLLVQDITNTPVEALCHLAPIDGQTCNGSDDVERGRVTGTPFWPGPFVSLRQ